MSQYHGSAGKERENTAIYNAVVKITNLIILDYPRCIERQVKKLVRFEGPEIRRRLPSCRSMTSNESPDDKNAPISA